MGRRWRSGTASLSKMNNIINVIESELGTVDTIPASGVGLVSSRIAQELGFWQDGNRLETDQGAHARLKKYWDNISYGSWTPTGTAWSAAFVSYLLRDTGFPGESAHYAYSQQIADGKAPGWTAYSIPKNQGRIQLNPGDILVRPRGSGTPQDAEYWYSHGDVVWHVGQDAVLVGGNLGESAKVAERIQVDSKGYPIGPITRYTLILKKKKDTTLMWLGLGALGVLAVWKLQ